MQLATLQELSFDKIDQTSDTGLSSFVDDTIVDVVKVPNDLLNTSATSLVGEVFNTVGLTLIHQLADTLGYDVLKGIAAVGGLPGGDTDRIGYHCDTEWT